MHKPYDLSIVIPSFQEEENLRILLPRIQSSVGKLNINFEILVIDSMHPMDNTKEVALSEDSIYIPRTGGNNYGDAIRTGIKNAKGQYIVIMDADGSHPPEYIQTLYNNRFNANVIIASRYIDNGFTENPGYLILMSRILNWTYSFVLNLNCKDVSNSFRLYTNLPLMNISLKCDNFDIVEEILIKIVRDNPSNTIMEVPFTFKKRMFGFSKRNLFIFIFGYIATLIKLKFFI